MRNWKVWLDVVMGCVIGAMVGQGVWEATGDWWLSAALGITVAWVWGHVRQG
jgi:hypothetical protein